MRISVLDHGYVELVEKWGSDEGIIEAARMSTDKGFLGWGPVHSKSCPSSPAGAPKGHSSECCDGGPGDEKLLRFLYENKHATPFEMAGAQIEVVAPIFVFRQWHRHRTQSYNEMSGRYTQLPDFNYVPTVDRLLMSSKKNKQAGAIAGAAEMNEETAAWFRTALVNQYSNQEALYQEALNRGIPKELARIHVGVGRYSKMRAQAVLRNWLGFLSLRLPENAQWEERQYAGAVASILETAFPRTMALFKEGK